MSGLKKPELLAPAGNPEKLEIAYAYGADAAYIGGEVFSLRAGAGNFSMEEMAAGVRLAHSLGKRLYVAANIFAHNRDLDRLPEFLQFVEEIGVDGLIVSDPGVIAVARRVVPSLPLHLSTQANCTNKESALFWEGQGLERIILARELSLEEIREIRDTVSLELEVFVHGAMCVSYSGRCLLSSFLTGRSANRGDCSHPCRWKYHLVEEKRPGEYFPVYEDDRGTYILNANDLSMIEHIPELIAAGVNSFKIEGRMKSVYYVATVVKAYREAIDAWAEDPENWVFREKWLEELGKASHRTFSTGFFFGKPGSEDQNYVDSGYIRTHDFVGKVLEYFPREKIAQGDVPLLTEGITLEGANSEITQQVPTGSTESEKKLELASQGMGSNGLTPQGLHSDGLDLQGLPSCGLGEQASPLEELVPQGLPSCESGQKGSGWALVEQRNKFCVGDTLEVFGPGEVSFSLRVEEIRDLEGNSIDSTPHPKQQVLIPVGKPVAKNYLLRKPS